MKPITFACNETLPLSPDEIGRQMLDLSNWPQFNGYGPIPGIQSATFEIRTPDVVGTRIQVTNRDGSRHVEEIVDWQPDRIEMHMKDFSPPLSKFASRIEEVWTSELGSEGTNVTRTFHLYPKTFLSKVMLRIITFFLKRGIARHLRDMKGTQKPVG